MKRSVLVALAIMLINTCYAGDTIIVHKDGRLDILAAKQAAINNLTRRMAPYGQYKGFRLQIAATNSRDDAFKAKAIFLQYYPDGKSYVSYQSPNFRVRVGNFNKREGAQNFKGELSKIFTDGVDVVEDFIEYTPMP